MKIRVKIAIVAIFPLVAGFAGSASASAEVVHTDSFSLISHVCKVIGSDQFGNQGVACGDLLVESDGAGGVILAGQNEVLCQDSTNTVVECAGIHETAALCNGGGCSTFPGVCGVRFGHSPCGVRRVENAVLIDYFPCSPESWGDALDTSIVLPVSGKTVGPGPNVASGHGAFCG
jgi:hypothetical protein